MHKILSWPGLYLAEQIESKSKGVLFLDALLHSFGFTSLEVNNAFLIMTYFVSVIEK